LQAQPCGGAPLYSSRGWRLVKSAESAQIDAVIALAMAAERAEQPASALKFHGWL
jgi:hypothetical protein